MRRAVAACIACWILLYCGTLLIPFTPRMPMLSQRACAEKVQSRIRARILQSLRRKDCTLSTRECLRPNAGLAMRQAGAQERDPAGPESAHQADRGGISARPFARGRRQPVERGVRGCQQAMDVCLHDSCMLPIHSFQLTVSPSSMSMSSGVIEGLILVPSKTKRT